jgi:hypothetical protein
VSTIAEVRLKGGAEVFVVVSAGKVPLFICSATPPL